MNRQTIPPQTNPPYTNGHHETPLSSSGVSLHRPAPPSSPTVFAPDLPLRGLGPTFYALQRFHIGGAPVARYLSALWLLIALLAYFGIIPGHWFTVGFTLALWLAQIGLGVRLQRNRFITFTPAAFPVLHEQPLDTTEKLPIYATGLMNVEGRYHHYTALPGFYRTFATGEHAVLCRVPARAWLGISTWPPEETGMWYAFVNPGDIEQLAWGTLHFGPTRYPALRLDYRLEISAGPRRKKPKMRQERLYLAAPTVEVAQRLYADLLTNLPSGKLVTTSSAPE